MSRSQYWAAVVTLVVAAAAPVYAQQPSPAGRIKVVSGSAFVVRDAKTGEFVKKGEADTRKKDGATHGGVC